MKKIWTAILVCALSLSFAACGGKSSGGDSDTDGESVGGSESVLPTTYTVTWKNDDGSILETDSGVEEGSMPSYDGDTPTKAAEGDFAYSFSGWTPALAAVGGDITYTATFTQIYNGQEVVGMQPTLTEDGDILYGLYPQTRVADESLIATLDTLSVSEINGWYFYDGEYYAKEIAAVYSGESYTFDDGAAIESGATYWFKCQPIRWEILSNGEGSYYLLSSMLLDSQAYYANYESRVVDGATVYANNYAESDLRKWLNGEFYATAFALNSTYIQEVTVDNSAATSELATNPYASKNTADKVFLPSYQEYLNGEYGFADNAGKTTLREAKTTDYARATGAWCHTRNNSNADTQKNGSYWTRSASGEYYYCATVVNSGGVMSTYAVDDGSHSVRPAIYIAADGVEK